MTITVVNIVAGPFLATGAEQTLPFGFKVFTPSEVEVVTGVGSGQVEVDPDLYTVTRNMGLDGQVAEGGSILLSAGAVTAGAQIRAIAKPKMTQEQTYSDTSSRLKNLNEGLDRSALRALRAAYDGALEGAGADILDAARIAGGEAAVEAVDDVLPGYIEPLAEKTFGNVDPKVGRTALGVSPAPDVIVDGLIYNDVSKALQNWALLQAAQSNLPDGVITNVIIPKASGTLYIADNILNSLTKLARWVVPNGITLVGGDLYVDNKKFWDGSVPFEITTNRAGVGSYQATYRVSNHEDASTGPGSGDRFYYKKSGLSTNGFNIARTTLADFRNLNGGVGLCDWRLTVSQPKSGPDDTRTFFVYDSEINVVNLYADQGYERNIYGMANPVGGVFFVPEAQDFVEGRGGGYNVQFAFMLGHSGGNSPATGEKMKTYIGYGAAPNSIAAGGGLLVASGNNGDTGNGGGAAELDPGFTGQFWDTWDTGWDFSNATFRSGIYEKLPAGAKTKYGTGDFVSISGGVRTFQSGSTLYRETLTAGHMVVSTDEVPLNFEVSGFFNCIGALGGGLRIDGVQVVGPVMPYIAPASGAAGATPTKAEFDALVTSYNILLYYLRRGTGHGLLMDAP